MKNGADFQINCDWRDRPNKVKNTNPRRFEREKFLMHTTAKMKASRFRFIARRRPLPSSARLGLLLAGLLWPGVLALQAATHYVVPSNPSQANPYTSWGTAGTSIVEVVIAALTNATTPRIVWVSNSVAGGYVLTNQIAISGALTLRSTNGPDVTVINGGFVAGSPTTNIRCIYMTDGAAVVQDLTFSNGAVNSKTVGGGGVWMSGGILSNCNIFNNNMFEPSPGGYGGGGIYMSGGTVTACRVAGNMVTNFGATASDASHAGGIRTAGSGCLIYGCVISNNANVGGSSYSHGGGIYLNPGRIQSSMICNNSLANGDGGGIAVRGDKNVVVMSGCTSTLNQTSASYTGGGGVTLFTGIITNCVISYNYGANYGGGIFIHPNAGEYASVYNTTIMGNTNGGVLIYGTNPVINCFITDNTYYGVYMQGASNLFLLNCIVSANRSVGVKCEQGTIRDCLIAGNSNSAATSGGGLYIPAVGTIALISGCTIVSNLYTNAPGSGIRIAATNLAGARSISISSCVIYSNGFGGTDDVYDACAPTNTDVLQYSCIGTNLRFQFNGTMIITNNPRFVDFAGGNYRLNADSPCINTGSNENWMTNAVDLDTKPRIRYGTVDMGAYEHINKGTIISIR